MSVYNLYFESGNRAYVLHLSNEEKSKRPSILRENTNAHDELLRLSKRVNLISYENQNNDKTVYLKSIIINSNTTEIIYDEDNNSEVIIVGSGKNIFISDTDEEYILSDPANNANKLEEFSIKVAYKDYVGIIDVVCSPLRQIYDVVLDFGSEASQMLVQRRDSGTSCEPIDLFKNCARHFYNIETYSENEYDQQDPSSKLFRSIFFSNKTVQSIKNEMKTKEPIPSSNASNITPLEKAIISRPSKNESFISFISRRDKSDCGKRIPNVKISYLADLRPEGLDMKDLHRGLVMRFIYEALYYIADLERGSGNLPISIRITLLLPNVMCQNDVSSFVNSIKKYVKYDEFIKQSPQNLKLSIIDICTCSESDASLLNWINKQQTVEKGKYLIIDIGKGTTDFSIVNVKSATEAESVFRAGFVGAGNVLSYALFDNYMIHMGGVLGRETLIKKLLNAEPAMLNRLEQAIEKEKHSLGIKPTNNATTSIRVQNIGKATVESLIEKIEENPGIPDDFNIISTLINKIVIKEIAGRISILNFDHIVLSGRAFKYLPLYDEIHRIFKELFPTAKIHYDEKDAKMGCLYGPLTPIDISKFSNMVGEPKSVDSSRIHELELDIDKKVESLNKKGIRDNDKERIKITSDIIENLKSVWKSLFDEGEDDEDNKSTSSDSISDSPIQNEILHNPPKEKRTISITDIMKEGIHIENYGAHTKIYISSYPYKLANDYIMEKNKEYSLYFDGEDFYLRSDSSCWALRRDTTVNYGTPLLFESLFPFSLQLLGENYDIPLSNPIKVK